MVTVYMHQLSQEIKRGEPVQKSIAAAYGNYLSKKEVEVNLEAPRRAEVTGCQTTTMLIKTLINKEELFYRKTLKQQNLPRTTSAEDLKILLAPLHQMIPRGFILPGGWWANK